MEYLFQTTGVVVHKSAGDGLVCVIGIGSMMCCFGVEYAAREVRNICYSIPSAFVVVSNGLNGAVLCIVVNHTSQIVCRAKYIHFATGGLAGCKIIAGCLLTADVTVYKTEGRTKRKVGDELIVVVISDRKYCTILRSKERPHIISITIGRSSPIVTFIKISGADQITHCELFRCACVCIEGSENRTVQ